MVYYSILYYNILQYVIILYYMMLYYKVPPGVSSALLGEFAAEGVTTHFIITITFRY